MRAVLCFLAGTVFLFLACAFGYSLYEGFSFSVAELVPYRSLGLGVAVYFGLRVLLRIFGRNLDFAETFCHELNHTVFCVLTFHKVESFFAHSEEGGHVTFSGGGDNPLIALAPYSFPLFAAVFSLFTLFTVPDAQPFIQGAVGFFLMFHLASVFGEARPRQTDLQIFGYYFSYAAIFLANIVLVPFIARSSVFGFRSGVSLFRDGFLTAWNWILMAKNFI